MKVFHGGGAAPSKPNPAVSLYTLAKIIQWLLSHSTIVTGKD